MARHTALTALLAAWLLGAAPGLAATRLAIIAPPDCNKEAALLMADLSSKESLELVERKEIDKIFEEQNLQGLTTGDPKKLGGILKADGLVLLEKTPEAIQVRLVDVDSGAVLKFLSFPTSTTDPAVWSRFRADEIARTAMKLSSHGTKLVPISLLRINAAQGGAQGKILEENLNLLLVERLSANAGIILLERWKLQEAAAEKAFFAESGAFWNSSWVVDGSLTPVANGYLLDLRLQPPGGSFRNLKITGPDAASVAEKANAEILQALEQPVTPWDSKVEAARFVEEARWAARNNFWDQAAKAIEAGVILGDRRPEMLEWRWKCYNRLASNYSGEGLSGGFYPPPGDDLLADWQILAMARSLQLCRESLAGAISAPRGRLAMPTVIDDRAYFGNGPVAEASALLASASRLLVRFAEERKRPEMPQDEALRELRLRVKELFDEIVAVSPDLQFRPRPGTAVPPWDDGGDPSRRDWGTGSSYWSRTFELRNIHMVRLREGLRWEESPEPYFDYLQQCFQNDLPIDRHFYAFAVDTTAYNAVFDVRRYPNSFGPAWKAGARRLANEKSPSVQIAGAAMLFCTGSPVDALEIAKSRRNEILSGQFPVEYLAEGYSRSDMRDEVHIREDGGGSVDAKPMLERFLADLLKDGLVPSQRLITALRTMPKSRQEIAELAAVLKNPPEATLRKVSREEWDRLTLPLLHRLEPAAGKAPSPPVQPSATPKPATTAGNVPSLQVTKAWAARSAETPELAGVIRWVHPDGDRLWLQVDYEKNYKPVWREYVVVDLPSLASRVVHRDKSPDSSSSPDAGPVFATDGTGIYGWNGRGITYAKGGTVREIQAPELVDPKFWLVGSSLYCADRLGVLIRYDTSAGGSQIIASGRRRPPQNPLDAESGLDQVRRVSRGSDGVLTVDLPMARYRNSAPDVWAKDPSKTRKSEADIVSELEYGWENQLASRWFASEFLRGRGKKPKPGGNPHAGTYSRYLGISQPEPGKPRESPPQEGSAAVSGGTFWGLAHKGLDKTWIVRIRIADDVSFAWSLVFPGEYEPDFAKAGSTMSHSVMNLRLIPMRTGVVLYSPGAPVLWFIPAEQLAETPVP